MAAALTVAPVLSEKSAPCIDLENLKVHMLAPFRLAAGHADTGHRNMPDSKQQDRVSIKDGQTAHHTGDLSH